MTPGGIVDLDALAAVLGPGASNEEVVATVRTAAGVGLS